MSARKEFHNLPVYWESENGRGVIVYEQFAFSGKYKLYIKGYDGIFQYSCSDDFLGRLIKYANKNYYVRYCK